MKVNEIFYSLQGEGEKTGTPAVFLRFSGCNLNCPFCDTLHQKAKELSEEEIVSKISSFKCKWVVLTGGEPSSQLTPSLVDALHKSGKKIAIETNGTNPINGNVDFITLSPKDTFCKNAEIKIDKADEIKIVFDGKINPQKYLQFPAKHFFLQPCDTGNVDKNKKLLFSCIEYIKKNPKWRLSLQTQKIINIK